MVDRLLLVHRKHKELLSELTFGQQLNQAVMTHKGATYSIIIQVLCVGHKGYAKDYEIFEWLLMKICLGIPS